MGVLDGVLTGGGAGGGAAGIGGSTGATDNALLISDGTGGATLAASTTLFQTASGNLAVGGLTSSFGAMRSGGSIGGLPSIAGIRADEGAYGVVLYFDRYYIGDTDVALERKSVAGSEWIEASDGGGSSPKAFGSAVRVLASTAGSGAPYAITAIESGSVLTNEGATAANYHTLPTAVAGYEFTFIVQDADGLRITAGASDTIRVIDKVTAAAGYIESTTIGSVVTLVSVNAVEWYVKSIHGVWTDGTFTFDDTALTTP